MEWETIFFSGGCLVIGFLAQYFWDYWMVEKTSSPNRDFVSISEPVLATSSKKPIKNATTQPPNTFERSPLDSTFFESLQKEEERFFYKDQTLALHIDAHIEKNSVDIAPPLHFTTTFLQENSKDIYSRVSQPTRTRTEAVLSALEGGQALTFSTGMAAIAALFGALEPRRILYSSQGYQGTRSLIEQLSRTHTIVNWNPYQFTALNQKDSMIGSGKEEPKNVDLFESIEGGLSKGDIVWLECPLNPTSELINLKEIALRLQDTGALLCVDATFASPVLIKPLLFGVDVVMHSTTKLLAGHHDALGGALITKNRTLYQKFKQYRNNFGNTMGILEGWLLLRNLRTVHIQVREKSNTTSQLIDWLLKNHDTKKVKKIHHPLVDQQKLLKEIMVPPIFSLEFHTSKQVQAFLKGLTIITKCTSLGGCDTTIDWRAQYSAQPQGLVRISVGLEDISDLIKEFSFAFKAVEEIQ